MLSIGTYLRLCLVGPEYWPNESSWSLPRCSPASRTSNILRVKTPHNCCSLQSWILLFRNLAVAAFLPEGLSEEDLRYLLPLTQSMLAGVSIYVFAHATSLVFLATLRASGDTRWCMWASVLMEWICCALVFMSVRIWHLPPITTWMIFITAISIYALAVYLRFVGNRWKAIRVV